VLLDRFVDQLRERGLVRARGRQRTDSTHVLAAVRALSTADWLADTPRARTRRSRFALLMARP
jgi:hypothetical protein